MNICFLGIQGTRLKGGLAPISVALAPIPGHNNGHISTHLQRTSSRSVHANVDILSLHHSRYIESAISEKDIESENKEQRRQGGGGRGALAKRQITYIGFD